MTTQEQIIGKVAQAKAIRQAMSYTMPTEIFRAMNNHAHTLLEEASDLNVEQSGENFIPNVDAITDAISTNIVEKFLKV